MDKEEQTNKREEIKGHEILSFNFWLLINLLYCIFVFNL